MKIDRKNNAIRNAFWGYFNKMLSILLPFAFRTIIIYNLSSEYLGLNSLFTSILQVLSLSELGVGTAIVYSMYKPIAENDKKMINALLNLYKKLYRFIGFAILIIGIIILPILPKLISGSYPSEINIYAVYFCFLINTTISYWLFGYRTSLLNAFQRNDIEHKLTIVSNILLYVTASIFIYIAKNYYAYLVIMIFTTVLRNILIYFATCKNFAEYKCDGKIKKEQKLEIRKNVYALMCHKIGSTVLNSADNIVISSFLGLTVLAQYTNYYYIMNAISMLIIICFNGLTAGIGNSFMLESTEKNTEQFKKILFFNAFITIISATALMSVYQDFINLWVGTDYLLDFKIVILFIIYFFVHTIRRTILVFRDAAGMWWDNRFQPLVSGSFNLIINILLVNIIGIYGILISTIVSMIFIDIPWETIIFCKRKINFSAKQYFIRLILYGVILLLTCCLSVLLGNLIVLPTIISIFVKIIIAFIISNLILFIFFHRTKEYKYLIKIMLETLKHKKVNKITS